VVAGRSLFIKSIAAPAPLIVRGPDRPLRRAGACCPSHAAGRRGRAGEAARHGPSPTTGVGRPVFVRLDQGHHRGHAILLHNTADRPSSFSDSSVTLAGARPRRADAMDAGRGHGRHRGQSTSGRIRETCSASRSRWPRGCLFALWMVLDRPDDATSTRLARDRGQQTSGRRSCSCPSRCALGRRGVERGPGRRAGGDGGVFQLGLP
jgi:hypothetical protein